MAIPSTFPVRLVYNWISALRKRDIFRLFIVYVFMRHVPRQVEAPEHYLTGRQITKSLPDQSFWERIFNYFIEEPVRTVAIGFEAAVRKDFDASLRKERQERLLLEERRRVCDEEMESLKPAIELMDRITQMANQEISITGKEGDLEAAREAIEKVARAAQETLTNPNVVEELKNNVRRLEMAQDDLKEAEALLEQARDQFQAKLGRLTQLIGDCERLDLVQDENYKRAQGLIA